MGKTSATIKLIQILSARNTYISTNDLAELLDTNPRNIKEYIKEAEECGYVIESIKGVYGGYRLAKKTNLPANKITQEEIDSIIKGKEFIDNNPDFLNKMSFDLALGKILSEFEGNKMVSPITMIDRFPLSMDKMELQKRYGLFMEAIDGLLKVDIKYRGQKGNVKNHVIHPYKVFVYNGSWFVLAYNETVSDVGYFKFNRIDDMFVTRNHFTILKTFDEKDYLDEYSMKKNGDFYHVKLKIANMNAVMNERIYGKSQKIKEIDSKNIIFECDMQNKDMILSFVLSLGKNCEVLEPDWLIENVKSSLWKMMEYYE